MVEIENKNNHITFVQVERAVAELKSQHCKVTIRAIRDHVGYGSFSTISKFLSRLSYCEEANLPSSYYAAQLPDRLGAIIKATYTELVDAAAALNKNKILEIQELEQRLRARWSTHLKDKLRAIRNLEAETQHSADIRAELSKVTARTWKDQEAITDLTARVVKAESDNQHLQELVEEYKKRCANLTRNLEHFEQQVLRQRQADSQMHLLKVAKLEQDLMSSQAQVLELSKEIAGVAKKQPYP